MPDTLEIQEGLIIRPGDKLLVRVDPDKTNHIRVQELAEQLRERFPEVEVVVVLAVEQLAVVRPE